MKQIHALDMNNLSGIYQGRITAWSSKDYMVRLQDGRNLLARRAAGCLLRPEAGDLVLIAVADGQSAYILSVLERASQDGSCLDLGGISFREESGGLKMELERLEVGVRGRASLSAADLESRAARGSFYIGRFSLFSKRALFHSEKMGFLGGLCHFVMDGLIQRLRFSRRSIEGIDFCRAGRMRRFIKEVLFMKARRTSIKAEEKMKIDGRKIDLG